MPELIFLYINTLTNIKFQKYFSGCVINRSIFIDLAYFLHINTRLFYLCKQKIQVHVTYN